MKPVTFTGWVLAGLLLVSGPLVQLPTAAAAPLFLGPLFLGSATVADGPADQIVIREVKGRSQSQSTLSGTILESSLSEVVIEIDGKQRSVPSERIVRVVLGHVPPAFLTAKQLLSNGDFENAINSFRLVASDTSAGGPVQSAAAALALEAQYRQALKGGGDFAAVAGEAARFVGKYAQARELPSVRALEAKALWSSGKVSEAAARFEALASEAKGATANPGYDLVDCYRAAWSGIEARLELKDAAAARKAAKALESDLPAALAELAPEDVRRARLEAIGQCARLAEGFALLGDNKGTQAKTFFRAQVDGAKPAEYTLRTLALVGLGEAQLQQGELRDARIAFARAFATGSDTPDALSRALVGLATCTLELAKSGGAETGSKELVRIWLDSVRTQFGGTPSARRAAELAKDL